MNKENEIRPKRLILDRATTARGEDVLYAARFEAKEAMTTSFVDGRESVVTPEGKQFWVVEEPEGWVQATSSPTDVLRWNGEVPLDVKLWRSFKEADEFMRNWRGHPWYARPKTYEIVKIVLVFSFSFDHFEILK